jgi:hypothetical protein
MVCIQRRKGGLGVIDLKSHDEALMMKNLHKFFNRVSIIWEKLYPNGRLPNHVKKWLFLVEGYSKFFGHL